MKEKRIYSIKNLPKGKTDWQKVATFSDAEIETAAKHDKDAPLSTKKHLKTFKRVCTLDAKEVKNIRLEMQMSQVAFAKCFGISERTLQEWEQGRRVPQGPACMLLLIIRFEPKAVRRVLENLHKI